KPFPLPPKIERAFTEESTYRRRSGCNVNSRQNQTLSRRQVPNTFSPSEPNTYPNLNYVRSLCYYRHPERLPRVAIKHSSSCRRHPVVARAARVAAEGPFLLAFCVPVRSLLRSVKGYLFFY
ncbi:hypothetical protein HN51_040804, partial [Arachis hypogaea]